MSVILWILLGILAVIGLGALFFWLEFRAWRRENNGLDRRHWLSDGDYPDSTTTEDAE